MRIGVLGTGMVGKSIATKLVELGNDVMMGSRTANNESAAEWVASAGSGASQGTFADTAAFGELVFNCTAGAASVEAVSSVLAQDLAGKTLIDLANHLDFSQGMPPGVVVSSTDSLAEQIQRAVPSARVVKTLNTVNHEVMVDPEKVPGRHDMFVCGNDESAKAEAVEVLRGFGWPAEDIVDLGDLSAARGTEAYLLLWVRLWGVFQTGHLNIKVVC